MNDDIFHTNLFERAYFKSALPLVLGLIMTLIYNLADTYFIGYTKNIPLIAGVSLCSPIFLFLMGLGNIFGQGGNSLILKYFGNEDMKGTKRVSSFCLYAALLTSFVISSIMLLCKYPLLDLIGASKENLYYADQYYTILAVGAPSIILSYVYCNLIRCEGFAFPSIIGIAGGALLNILLNPLLIQELHMGARGAALATVSGYTLSDLYFLVLIKKKSSILSLDVSDYRIKTQDLTHIFALGIASGITNIIHCTCNILINQFLLPYGDTRIAAMGIVLKVNMSSYLLIIGFAFVGLPLYRYFYGENDQNKNRDLLRFCIRFISILSITITFILYMFAPILMRCFINDEAIITAGTEILRWNVSSTIFIAFIILMNIYFQVIGHALPCFMISISRQGIIYVLVLSICVYFFDYKGLLMSQAISEFVSLVMAAILFMTLQKKML